MKYSIALSGLIATALAIPSTGVTPNTRANFPIPASKGSVTYTKPQTISGTFDGGLKTYGRGVSCTGQAEGGNSDAVFILEDGATLKNAIIGADQIEGVHCLGSCTINNVWWKAVCEDALTLKGDGNANVIGGGATGAEDKVIQHNGLGTVTIDGFTVVDFGKLYRACGNCKTMGERNVIVKNVKAYSGKKLVGINSNKGDVATITNTCATSVKEICAEYEGTTPGNEPKEISTGISSHCKYTSVPAC
ncbi:pectate lyase [Grosmannia clavigera kw1407]|uniref:Pectate lyase n=1 Tax=Grosmannia clavigera (strain kw1407 / UAMH 11150) TaxID=655863 RepID=F0XH79_GROCL|nr:pectate lyase [Grosmannia clavigera kw1407]EFX02836.1 pectate lyase [Grosmannia clavigera kw1407]